MDNLRNLTQAAAAVLNMAEAGEKAALGRAAAAAWRAGRIREIGAAPPPERPARPSRPILVAPRKLARRAVTPEPRGRIALLYALAHIELNAVDLAWDLIARFPLPGLPREFYDDWVAVADDEARHFGLLSARLTALGAAYGDLPAHDGLWQAAAATRGDLLARLAVVPLVLEARGLDVTPAMIAKLEAAKDHESADVLARIYRDEITHVAAGKRWFDWLCRQRKLDPSVAWPDLVRRHFKGRLKPPFNAPARAAAGLAATDYVGLSGPL